MRNIPDNNLAYPNLITFDSGISGSGFQLKTPTDLYFITAKHVLFNKDEALNGKEANLFCQSADVNEDAVTIINVDFNKLLAANKVFQHSKADVAAFLIGKTENITGTESYRILPIDGIVFKQYSKSGMISVKLEAVKLLKDVLVSNDVYVYGYPSSLGLKHMPQFDYQKPLLRKGIIANIYKKLGTMILDCPVYYGNSGGAVVQLTNVGNGAVNHNVIGVISEFVPYIESWRNESNGIVHDEMSNSGYSVAVSMDFVYEMLGIEEVDASPVIAHEAIPG